MAKFRKKPVVVDVMTFDEFVNYAKAHSLPPHWSFDYNGCSITHEHDACYLIPTLEGVFRFTPEDVLITGIKGEIYPCKVEIFNKIYEPL